MLGFQETLGKDPIKKQLREIQRVMDSTGSFHPGMLSGDHEPIGLSMISDYGLRLQVQEMLRKIPLKEFLAKSGTTGIAGAAYMVPDKVHSDLVFYSRETDIVPLISASVVDGWKGGDLKVNIVSDSSYKAKYYTSGGAKPTSTVEVGAQATLSPVTFGVPIFITDDLLEDNNLMADLLDFHIRNAAKACGDLASDMALTVLQTGTDGVGTVNSGATGDADETRLVNGTTTDVGDAVIALGDDKFVADTMVATPSAWGHSIATQASEVGWQIFPGQGGYNLKLSDIDVLKSTSEKLHASTDALGAAFTNNITLIFSRQDALLTGRKRWLKLDNYSDPIKSLAGATVSCRQDSVSLFNDAVFVLTET